MHQAADTELVRLLMEIGYVAIGSGMGAQAETLFAAVRAARPSSESPLIGLALSRLNVGDHAEALRLLGQEIHKVTETPSDLAKAFHGLALRLAGSRAESEALLRWVASAGSDPAAISMAQSLLSEPA